MANNTRVRINLNTREIEWDGSEEFIAKYDNVISEFLEVIKNSPNGSNGGNSNKEIETNSNSTQQATKGETNIPENFGEFYVKFPRGISVSEKMLTAGYFLQTKSSDGLFTPSEASALLREQAVNVSNANAFITSLVNTNKIFKVAGKCKISEKGIDIINQMLKSN